jgi:DNA uptake protein ComE-like DNA-binding protein
MTRESAQPFVRLGRFALAVTLALAMGVLAGGAARADERLELNGASLEQIRELPVPPEVAQAIWERREFVDYYLVIQDLLDVEGMTPVLLESLRPLVVIEAVPLSPERQRKEDLFYRFEWWEGAEGTDESLVELYKDLALDPVNVNRARIVDLQNLQNVSPVDAVAIAKHRARVGRIGNQSELRRATGLSGWGYSNIRTFLSYEDDEGPSRTAGNYSLRVETTSYFDEVEELLRDDRDPGQGTHQDWWDFLGMDNAEPAVYQKVSVRHGRKLYAGGATSRRLGEEDLFDSKKAFVGVEDLEIGPLKVEKLYVGNYLVSWGQGVLMENNDFRSSRKSGYNFAKRYDGILGDLSRTEEYALRGLASEASLGPLRAIAFWSEDDRDAILNDDGSVNLLVRLTPRIDNEDLRALGLRPMRDQLHEETWGGNLRYEFGWGNHVGVGGYESRYDRFFDPKWDPDDPTDKHPLIADENEDVIVAQDGELFASYKSPGKYRRIYGADFQYVFRNVAFQGEYAEMDIDGDTFKIGDDPSALVLNSYVQYENLTFLTLYRDYDVGFDNPYQRSFSNYERFKGTIVEDFFRLEDPIYGMVYTNSAQPQAERGFYVSTRYRWSDPFITTIEYDAWRRQADLSKYSRLVGRLEYRLLFPLRFKLRHKWQNRELENPLDPSIFNNVETRMELEYRLSRFDQLEFLYARSYTQWPPRGRLQGEPQANGNNPIFGSNMEPSNAWGAWWTHNFENRRLKLDGAFFVYDGFLWFFEKSTFRVADGSGFRTWVEVTDRLSDDLTVRLRWVRDNPLRNTAVTAREFNEEVGEEIDADNVHSQTDYFRIQADYSF